MNGVVGEDKALIQVDDVGALYWGLWEDPAGKWRGEVDIDMPEK